MSITESREDPLGQELEARASALSCGMSDGKDEGFVCLLEGTSMEPVLRERDLLLVEAYNGRQVRRGDVVLFEGESQGTYVAHRVVGETGFEFMTRGDGNSKCDIRRIAPSEVVGKVALRWRAGKKMKVWGGLGGRLLVGSLRLRLLLDRLAVAAFHRVYYWLADVGLLRTLLAPRLSPRLVAFGSRDEPQLRLLLGRHVVGWYRWRNGSWHIKRPFRLLVDETRLPAPARQERSRMPSASLVSSVPRLHLDATRDLAPEIELLLSCARVSLDDAGMARIRRLSGRVRNWRALLRLGHRHAVIPLVHNSLQRALPGGLPAEISSQLHEDYLKVAERNRALACSLRKLVEALASAGVSAVPLKGPELAELLYGDVALRQSGDLDLLVSDNQVAVADAVLLGLGFRRHEGESMQAGASGPCTTGRWYHADYFRQSDRLLVELHWDLVPRTFSCNLDPAAILSRLKNRAVKGQGLASLELRDSLLYLCVHGTYHQWARLSWICDVAEILRRRIGLDWDETRRFAEKVGAVRMLRVGMLLAHGLLEAPLPLGLLPKLAGDSAARSLAERVVREYLFPESCDESSNYDKPLYYLRSRERTADKLRLLYRIALVPNERDELLFAVPKFASFLRIPLRSLRLLYEYALRPAYEARRRQLPDRHAVDSRMTLFNKE